MSVIAAGWRLAVRRRGAWAGALVGAGAFTVVFLVDRAAALNSARISTGFAGAGAVDLLVVLALVVVAFGPVVLRGRGVSSSRRFDLLPFSPARRALLRFATDSSGALGVGTVAVVLSLWSIGRLPVTAPWLVEIRAVQVVFGFAAAVLLSDVLATHLGSRLPNLVYWASLLVALVAVQYFAEFPLLLRPPEASSAIGSGAPWPGIHGQIGSSRELALAVLSVIGTAVLLWIEIRVRANPVRRGGRRRQSGILQRLYPARDALAAKERAYVLRPVISRNAIAVSALIPLGAFLVRQPLLHVVAFGFWILFSQNVFAFDLPSGGVTRYVLAPMAISRVVHARERAMWRVVAAPVLVLALPALPFVPLDRWLLLWPFLAFGSGLFFLCATAGRFTSSRAPRAVARSAVLVQGSFIGIRGYFIIAAVTGATILVALVASAALRMATSSSALAVGAGFGLVGIAASAAYLAACRWERRHARLLFASEFPAGA